MSMEELSEKEKPEIEEKSLQTVQEPVVAEAVTVEPEKPVEEKKKKGDRILRKCKHCAHSWLSNRHAKHCAKCKRYIGVFKEKDAASAVGGISVEHIEKDLEGLPAEKVAEETEKKAEAAAAISIPESTVDGIIGMPFNTLAHFRGKFWELSKGEKKDLTPLVKKVIEKYLGKWFAERADEIALAIALGLVIMGRVVQDVKEHKKEEKKEEPKTEEKGVTDLI